MAQIKRSQQLCSNCHKESPQCRCTTKYRPYTHSEWECDRCKTTVSSHGGRDTECPKCGAQYNGSGQRLRDDWRGNPSLYNDDIGDLDGFEIQHAGD